MRFQFFVAVKCNSIFFAIICVTSIGGENLTCCRFLNLLFLCLQLLRGNIEAASRLFIYNLSTFHNMHFDTSRYSGKWSDSSGRRISSLTSTKIFILCFKLARFIVSICDSRSKMQTTKLYIQLNENWDWSEKKISLRQPPSPPLEIPGPLTSSHPWNFQSLLWGGGEYGYFLELHNFYSRRCVACTTISLSGFNGFCCKLTKIALYCTFSGNLLEPWKSL